MPLAQGLMLLNRYNVYSTLSSFTISPGSEIANAGDRVTFSIAVRADSGIAAGNVSIVNAVNNTIIASGVLDGYGTASLNVVMPADFYMLELKYDGYQNSFLPSLSDVSGYAVNKARTNVAIISPTNANPNNYYATAQSYNVTAYVTSTYGVPTGTIKATLWSTATNSIVADGYGTVGIDGYANIAIPANTLVADGYGKHLQISYYGTGSYKGSTSPGGLSGPVVTPIYNDTTHTAIAVPDADFYMNVDNPLFIAITADHFGSPSVGSIHAYATQIISGISILFDLGIAVPVAGHATITIPANTFTHLTNIRFIAYYTGVSQIYANSNSSPLTVIPF